MSALKINHDPDNSLNFSADYNRRGGQVLPFALNAKNKTGPAPRKTNAISAI